jgi:fructokinase
MLFSNTMPLVSNLMSNPEPAIICFGETLWDVLPQGRLPGGAPMNVAIHLRYQGFAPLVISRLGDDPPGHQLRQVLREKGVDDARIQTDPVHQTGIVQANVTNNTEVTYQIVEDVAWDHIAPDEAAARRVGESYVFVYGSLAARHETSRNTLLGYLQLAKRKVFDVNLRPPHYTPERTLQLLAAATLVKMNHHELAEITGWLGGPGDLRTGMTSLKDRYGLEAVIVTRAENGAAALTGEGYFEHPGFRVTVQDTIGSGDAFLATFLVGHLRGEATAVTLERACRVGAYVATQRGATPPYDAGALDRLLG